MSQVSSVTKEAITYYDKALAISPNSFNVLYSKGVALDKLGRHRESIVYYDKLIKIYPDDVYSLVRKGAALDRLGKQEEATRYYEEAITYDNRTLAIDPNNSSALYNKSLDIYCAFVDIKI